MDDAAQLKTALADRYAIEKEVGRGGMATVYLARDLRHTRNVALKVLSPELGAVLGVERFLSEIRVTANLQHPNLLPLFDSGEADGLLFYVMPYVEGESLRHRLEREKQLPIDEAVAISVAIANALDYAHRHGVIHRDLKPENILLHDGQPLVADFGIALAVSKAGGQRVTQTGLSLGTPMYMSPEQATGERVIDGRTDIYALGAVTYEMLAGEPPHTGSSAQAIIARLMTEEPRPLGTLRRTVPPNVEAAVHRALEKLPADRFATAKEFADALSDRHASALMLPSARSGGRAPRWREMLPWTVAAVAVAAAVAGWAGWARSRGSSEMIDTPVVRFPIGVGEGQGVAPGPGIHFAISPDDRLIAYGGQVGGAPRLMVRAVDRMEARPLAASGIQMSPEFSPDGKSIAAVSQGKLLRVPVDGSPPGGIAELNGPVAGMTWLPNDSLIVSYGGKLVILSSHGGTMRTISTPDSSRGEVAQWGPHLEPAGTRVVYVSVGRDGVSNNRIGVVPLTGGRPTITNYRGTTVAGVRHGHALWVTVSGALVAAPLDALTEKANGEPVSLLDGVFVGSGGAAKLTMSSRGSLVYEMGEATAQLMLVTSDGAGTPLSAERRAFTRPRWSPDGARIATAIRTSGSTDIWIYTVATSTLTRLTNGGDNDFPEWMPDGTRIVYRSASKAGTSLRWIRADGSGAGGELLSARYEPFLGSVSPDGKLIVFRNGETARSTRHVMVAPVDGSAPPRPAIGSSFDEVTGRLSPDGHFIAYIGDESGAYDVYIQAFPGPGPRVQVSPDGGREPLWSRDGKTLYYWHDRTFTAASVRTTPSLAIAERRPLFTATFLQDPTTANYDASPDGKHFLMLQGAADADQSVAVLGWDRELREKLGVKGAKKF